MKFQSLNYLYLIWLVPGLIVFFYWSFKRKDILLKRFCSEKLLTHLIASVNRKRQVQKAALLIIVVLFFIISLTRPKWGFHWEDIKRMGVDIVIALDVSKSMTAKDVEPNRLERAKREVMDLINMLEGDRIGLVAFAGTAFLQCPLTLDYGATQIFLDSIATDLIPIGGTAIGTAIRKSIEAFDDKKRSSKAVILITDGEDHGSDPEKAAEEAKKKGVKIFTIGIGSEKGAPLPADSGGGFKKDRNGEVIFSKIDEVMLQKAALLTGGSYVRSVTGDLDLEEIYKKGIKEQLEQRELLSTRKKKWEDRFQWFILIAIIFLISEQFISETVQSRRRRKDVKNKV